MNKPLVGILMGSDSDLPVMQAAAQILDQLGVPWEITVSSAHRTPDQTAQYAQKAIGRGIKVIIAGAGGAAHLAGVIAAHTTLPVIGVPIAGGALKGQDALLATVQMPSGVPVATVAINGAKNAGLLAAQIIATADPDLQATLSAYKQQMAHQVQQKAALLQELGPVRYLAQMGGN